MAGFEVTTEATAVMSGGSSLERLTILEFVVAQPRCVTGCPLSVTETVRDWPTSIFRLEGETWRPDGGVPPRA